MSNLVMARLGELDLPDRLSPTVPRWVTQLAVALLCAAGIELTRAAVNAVAPGSAVFALVFPAIMMATLFARWQAGLLTGLISICYTFFVVYLPNAATRTVIDPHLAVFAVAVAALLTIALAEAFRRAVRRATQERDRQIADRDLMLSEFEHRVKNNFAIVAGMLDIQRRRVGDPAAADALGAAMMRVDSIARAHRHLYRDGQGSEVNVRDYLQDLCGALSDALLLRGGVTLDCDADAATIQRDHAVSIGLVRQRKWQPRPRRSSITSSRWASERPSRSSFQITSVSPLVRLARVRASSGRAREAPEAFSSKIVAQPAARSASVWAAVVWSSVETRA